ncbi:MAG: SAM-dependent methyltransferase [Muribaculaceae bacterium]|nr:SAM-dependent methyltransferase [Muribaculaceae bacterium]
MKNEATIRFVREHREEDVRALALKARRDGEVDLPWALDQIQGWQTARRKLPSWAAIDGIVYPPHLSMEQCSSEQTAIYKCEIVERLALASHESLVDLTGGFGVDFAFMARCCKQAVYVERQEHLCETAKHNLSLLGLDHATVIHGDAEDILNDLDMNPASTLLYLDPARRDNNSNRTYAISDCTPDVLELRDRLFKAADHVLLKLSPMLDWHKAVSDLGERVCEVHILSVANECKELLILMSANHQGEPVIHCVNDNQRFNYSPSQNDGPTLIADDENAAYIYEPNASIMKAGCFGLLTECFPVKALATDSHLFVSSEEIENFPGRRFAITAVTSMNKKELGRALKGVNRANVATRNFPMTAQQLRQRLRLQDGGDCYIFGTTNADGEHLLYICNKL